MSRDICCSSKRRFRLPTPRPQSPHTTKHVVPQTPLNQWHCWTDLPILIQQYQIYSSMICPVLEDTHPVPWSTAPWIDRLRKFLHHINGQILLAPTSNSPYQRTHDCSIMDDIMAYNLPKFKLIHINSARLFLCINLLSEITDHTPTSYQHEPTKTSPGWYISEYQLQHVILAPPEVLQSSSMENLERNNPVDLHNKHRHHPMHTPRPVVAPILNKLWMGVDHLPWNTHPVPSSSPCVVQISQPPQLPHRTSLQCWMMSTSQYPTRHINGYTNIEKVHDHHNPTNCNHHCPQTTTTSTTMNPLLKNHQSTKQLGDDIMGHHQSPQTHGYTVKCHSTRTSHYHG